MKNNKDTEDNNNNKYFFVSYLYDTNGGFGSGRAYYKSNDKYFNSNNFDNSVKEKSEDINTLTIINYKEICKEEYEHNTDDLQIKISNAGRCEKHLKEISNEVYKSCITYFTGFKSTIEFKEDFNSFISRNSYGYDFSTEIRVIEPSEFRSFLETLTKVITTDKDTIEKLENKLKEKSFLRRILRK